jgi:hypothetical protein
MAGLVGLGCAWFPFGTRPICRRDLPPAEARRQGESALRGERKILRTAYRMTLWVVSRSHISVSFVSPGDPETAGPWGLRGTPGPAIIETARIGQSERAPPPVGTVALARERAIMAGIRKWHDRRARASR